MIYKNNIPYINCLITFVLFFGQYHPYNRRYIMKKETIKVKVDQTKLPNKMHFEVQKKMRAHVYKPKKGKGSFKRRKTIDFD